MLIPKLTILFVDAYDSFSNNIIGLLETTLCVSVRTIKIDDPALASDTALHQELGHYAAVVCGPGPGHPAKEQDVGVMKRIWKLEDEHILPVLGICLGFQSLCLEFGAKVERLRGPQHGIFRTITHVGRTRYGEGSLFEGVGELCATLYQSLCVDVGQHEILHKEWDQLKWQSPDFSPNLRPLAWAESVTHSEICNAARGVQDARVLVAVQHETKPFWALQYHPESICTNNESKRVIKNWFKQAQWFNRKSRRIMSIGNALCSQRATKESLLSRSKRLSPAEGLEDISPGSSPVCYSYRTINLPQDISVPDVVEAFGDVPGNQIILESSNTNDPIAKSAHVSGRYSIIGLDINDCARFEYRVGDSFVSHSLAQKCDGALHPRVIGLNCYGGIWPFLAQSLEKHRITEGNPESPFWGGFMGYTTYELGLEGIDVARASDRSHRRPDLSFAWVTRSIVVDHLKKHIYLQQLSNPQNKERGTRWMTSMASKLEKLFQQPQQELQSSSNLSARKCTIIQPSKTMYEDNVRLCQDSIRSGDSYELCLTDQTLVDIPFVASSSPWSIYKSLRLAQPSPYASYIRLGSLTFLSCSPERFLHCSASGICTLRPMKGTVKKSLEVDTLEKAKALLNVPKEQAENLMIVDLVRHDLGSVCGSAVEVKELMSVEEFRSVWQMSSVVEGRLPEPAAEDGKVRYTGLDVLAASLPPGSMTGAPKKRSCEILKEVEGKERSLYSGVVGYMDVGGRGDWSVNIRCMYKWDDETTSGGEEREATERWHIGAGGAVTALSTPEGEQEEMMTKLNGVLDIFRA